MRAMSKRPSGSLSPPRLSSGRRALMASSEAATTTRAPTGSITISTPATEPMLTPALKPAKSTSSSSEKRRHGFSAHWLRRLSS